MTRPQIVLPADIYDTLEFSALVYGGIGEGWYTSAKDYSLRGTPLCAFGHAMQAGIPDEVMHATDLHPDINDLIVCSLKVGRGARVPFDEYCREGNIVRGAA